MTSSAGPLGSRFGIRSLRAVANNFIIILSIQFLNAHTAQLDGPLEKERNRDLEEG